MRHIRNFFQIGLIQSVLESDLKSQRFVPFGANLAQLAAKPDTPGCPPPPCQHVQRRQSHVQCMN